MSCKHYRELFGNLTDKKVAAVSSFLSEYGLAINMETVGMSKEEWLNYHEKRMPADILDSVKETFKVLPEDLAKMITVDKTASKDLKFIEVIKIDTQLALRAETAKFRLREGIGYGL